MIDDRKFIIVVGDGMSDLPIEELGDKTPLEAANNPNMNFLAQNGICGTARTVPVGMHPASDTANLAIFGYNPKKYYTGRAPLEAINMGITLGENDVAFRCNLVTLNDGIMDDFSADHIDSNLTRIVIEEIKKHIDDPKIELYPGVSYRSLLVWRDYPFNEVPDTTPPHDIQGGQVHKYMPTGGGFKLLREITEKSWEIIQNSDVIQSAIKDYKGNPTSVWLWGGGMKPDIVPLTEMYGFKGYTISAVDLIHGIGIAAGLNPINVKGATGYIDTNYEGKVEAALEGLEKGNYVFLHIESPDESGHEGSVEHKIQSIEDIDSRVLKPLLEGLKKFDDYTILLMPDHPTPISLRTHTADPVPFCIYRNSGFEKPEEMVSIAGAFSEEEAKKTGVVVDDASNLIDIIVKGKF